MRKTISKIKTWLKANGFKHATVKSVKGCIVIDHIGGNDASTLASIATGLNFIYITESMTKEA